LLREIARALDIRIESLVGEGSDPSVDLIHATELLRRLSPSELGKARNLLLRTFGELDDQARRERIALIGLRGAGKSTLGSMLAEHMEVPFIELDRLIEQTAGVTLSVIFELYGQSGFRRLERRCLEDALKRFPRFVVATGGSLVSEPSTFERLLIRCFTVWLRATPDEHMRRVLAQGDVRPMADNVEAMTDLKRILKVREPLYSKADVQITTSEHSIQQCFELLLRGIASQSSAPR